jgi:hypothetical protein
MLGCKAFWQLYLGDRYLFKADRFIAGITYEVNVVIMVMPGRTFVGAEGIFYGIVGGGYEVDDTTFHKGLESAVYRYPVKRFAGLFFNIGVGKSAFFRQKKA